MESRQIRRIDQALLGRGGQAMINCSRAGLLARLNVVNEPIGDTRAKWPTTAISLNYDRPHEPRHLGLISDDACADTPPEKWTRLSGYF